MKTVNRLLKAKGSHVLSIQPDATVYDALKLMAEKNVGALLVLEKGKLVGILSERLCPEGDPQRQVLAEDPRQGDNDRAGDVRAA